MLAPTAVASYASTSQIHVVTAIPLRSFSAAVYDPYHQYTYILGGSGYDVMANLTVWNSANQRLANIHIGVNTDVWGPFYIPSSHEVWVYTDSPSEFHVIQGLSGIAVIPNVTAGFYTSWVYNPSNGYVYFASNTVGVYNGATNKFVASINMSNANYSPASMAYAPVNHEVYVANPYVGSGSGQTFIGAIKGTSVVAKITVPHGGGEGSWPMIYDPANNKIYVLDRTPYLQIAMVIDPTTNKLVRTLTVSSAYGYDYGYGDVTGVVYVPATKNIYVDSWSGYAGEDGFASTNISVINSATYAVTHPVINGNFLGFSGSMVYNPSNGDLYIGAVTTPTNYVPPPNTVLKVFSTTTNTMVTTLTIMSKHGNVQRLLFNPANGYVYDFTRYTVNSKTGPYALVISSS
jgi:DNA-binding beta-propeller fold protein YncE